MALKAYLTTHIHEAKVGFGTNYVLMSQKVKCCIMIKIVCKRSCDFEILSNYNFLLASLISLGSDISVEELSHSALPQYFSDVWHVFLQVFVHK